MKPLPPINDAILVALSQLVDDAQAGRRDPSHDQIGFCIEKAGLKRADPVAQGQPVGKAKRLRAVLSQDQTRTEVREEPFNGFLGRGAGSCGIAET